MNRDEVVKLMTDVVNDINKQMAWQTGMPSDQLNQAIAQMQPELNRVNGLIYDKLKSLGVIS
jgi:hypothetical protein